jgi:hypothetical protein
MTNGRHAKALHVKETVLGALQVAAGTAIFEEISNYFPIFVYRFFIVLFNPFYILHHRWLPVDFCSDNR